MQVKLDLGIPRRVGGADFEGAVGHLAQAAPLKALAQLKALRHQILRRQIALARDDAAKFVFHLGAALVDLAHQHQDALHHVQRLKPGNHHGFAVFLRKMLIRRRTDDDADMRRTHKTVNRHRAQRAHFRRLQNVRNGRGREHVAAQHAEVFHVTRRRVAQHQRGGRRGGFKANGEKHHFALRVGLGQLQSVVRRIHHANVRPTRLGLDERERFAGRHTHGVAVSTQHHAPIECKPDSQVDPTNGQHTHRAAGAVDHAHVLGQHVGQTIARNSVRVAAAKLHEVVVLIRLGLGLDVVGNAAGGCTVAEFCYVLHSCSCISGVLWSWFDISANNSKVRLASSGSILPMA